jgi:hypothetical protein
VRMLTAAGLELVAVLPADSGPLAIAALKQLVPQSPGIEAFHAVPADLVVDPLLGSRLGWTIYRAPDISRCPHCGKALEKPLNGHLVAVRSWAHPEGATSIGGHSRLACPKCNGWVEVVTKVDADTITLAISRS